MTNHASSCCVVMHMLQNRDQLKFTVQRSRQTLDHFRHLVAHAYSKFSEERKEIKGNVILMLSGRHGYFYFIYLADTYFDCAANWVAAMIAASTSTASWESKLLRIP